jgi:hypothetical protein
VLGLTAWGAPVSTSFLVLSAFVPKNIPKLLESSLSGYFLAFCLGLAAWGLGLWLLDVVSHHVDQRSSSLSRC